MINLCITLLPNGRVHAIPADIGKIIKPIPIFDKVIEFDVAPLITIVSTDSNNLFRVLYILDLFFELWSLSLKYVIFSLILLIGLLKLLTSFIFFSNRCSKSIFFLMVQMGIFYHNFGLFLEHNLSKLTKVKPFSCVTKMYHFDNHDKPALGLRDANQYQRLLQLPELRLGSLKSLLPYFGYIQSLFT